eukprot:12349915-Heterocapsa_arctica.AAC.1
MAMRVTFARVFNPSSDEGQGRPCMYLLTDSSPQAGYNWLNTECFYIHPNDVKACSQWYRDLVRTGKAADMSQEAGHEECRLVACLMDAVKHHHFIPVGLGSGRAQLVHEMHALFHQWYMETGDPK